MGVLLLLMTVAGAIAAVFCLIAALVTGKMWLAKFTVAASAIWIAFYAVLLVGFSLNSQERELGADQPKEYCGFYLDCHLHTAVTGIRRAGNIGDLTPRGVFYIVRVKVFSDARNPSITFRLLEPKAQVVLADGAVILRDRDAEELLPTAAVDLGADIQGRRSIEKDIVFDLPDTAPNPRLLITEGYGIDKLIESVVIDDEDSLFHAHTYFLLQPEQNVALGLK